MSVTKSQSSTKMKFFGKAYGTFLVITIIVGIVLGDFALIIPLINGNVESIPITLFIVLAALLIGVLALLIFKAKEKRF